MLSVQSGTRADKRMLGVPRTTHWFSKARAEHAVVAGTAYAAAMTTDPVTRPDRKDFRAPGFMGAHVCHGPMQRGIRGFSVVTQTFSERKTTFGLP